MAQIGGGNTGGRESNVELNLVPFIDLMSVCIIFLLVTAVWTQVSMIQLGSSIYSKKTEGLDVPPPREDVNLRLDVKSDGYTLVVGKTTSAIPKKDGAYDEATLMGAMKQLKTQYPDKADAMINVADEVVYEEAIRGMDVMLNSGFTNISVAAVGE
jgi:biopolymer transport protein TolR